MYSVCTGGWSKSNLLWPCPTNNAALTLHIMRSLNEKYIVEQRAN